MVSTPEPVKAWVRFFLAETDPLREELVGCLRQAGVSVDICATPDDLNGSGIILLSEIDSKVCSYVEHCRRNGVERIMALVCPGSALTDDGVWQVLHAGASDVLFWDGLPDLGGIVSARLRRWQEVDSLVESPLVKNNLVGQSQVWKSVLRRLVQVARFTDTPILLVGETGTGKELAARLIHTLHPKRHEHDLVVLDCTTIIPELSGSELFGHERGAFTGAVKSRDGAFAMANSGTLFLDEVGELSLELQVQLLRVLEERTYKRVGSNRWHNTDFRLICATNRDLVAEVKQCLFRRDLYYRIASWVVELPPLRDRIQDIIPLVKHFVKQARSDEERFELDVRVQKYFLTRDYPGNVRDLKNLVFRITSRHVGPGPITVGDIPPDERPLGEIGSEPWCDDVMEQAVRRALGSGAGLQELKRAIKDTAMRVALEDANGHVEGAASRLCVNRRTVQMWRAEEQQRIQSLIETEGDG